MSGINSAFADYILYIGHADVNRSVICYVGQYEDFR